jgi:predicted acylesterase/phospholipase RssA
MRYFGLVLSILLLVGCTFSRPENKNLTTKEVNNPTLVARDKYISVLAISGGGPNAAWSAGYLKGWIDKPKFDIVTGVSAGAITASHAFIGEIDCKEVEDLLVNLKQSDFVDMRPVVFMAFSNSASSNDRLKGLVSRIITNDVIDKVAKDADRRKLFVGTSDYDYGVFRIWDMTEIASKQEYDRYRSIILASASIPVVFPPVFIEEPSTTGNSHSMNFDGAVMNQVFVPQILPLDCHKMIYVLHNGVTQPSSKQQTLNSIKSVALRSAFLMTALNEQRAFDEIMATPNSTIYFSEIPNDVAYINFFSFESEDVCKVYQKAIQQGEDRKWDKIKSNN